VVSRGSGAGAPARALQQVSGMRPIVLDPGHGGSEPAGRSTPYGTRGPAGVHEKEVTLRVAHQLASRLGGRAVMTRTDDRNLSLSDRIGVAVQRDARAFVSIHAGTGAPSVWVHHGADPSSRTLAADLAGRLGARVEAAELAVLDPARFGGRTAACLVELGDLSTLRYGAGESLAAKLAQGLDDNIRWDVLENRLRYGCVVDLDVRINDSREPMSHAYPIDTAGKVKLPMVGLIDALDVSLQTLAQRVQAALANGFYVAPTVNATLKHRIVAYGANVTQDRLHVRILDSTGATQNDSGWYPVQADGTLNLPYVNTVPARGRRLDEVEAEVEAGYRNGYLNNAVVHVTPLDLDAA
jgi:N-acetylmuramoyl-L-alanine amidase